VDNEICSELVPGVIFPLENNELPLCFLRKSYISTTFYFTRNALLFTQGGHLHLSNLYNFDKKSALSYSHIVDKQLKCVLPLHSPSFQHFFSKKVLEIMFLISKPRRVLGAAFQLNWS